MSDLGRSWRFRTARSGSRWKEQRRVPWEPHVPLTELLYSLQKTWLIYCKLGRNEAGIFEVDLVVRTPDPAPTAPHEPKVVEIFGGVCDHVEREPVLVSGCVGWRYGILRMSREKRAVEPLLLGVAPACGCNPWLDAGTSRKVHEVLCEWLKLSD